MNLYIVGSQFPGRSNIYWSENCFSYSPVYWFLQSQLQPQVTLYIFEIMASCLPLSSIPSQLYIQLCLSTEERQWSQCEACTVALLGIFSCVDWNLGPFHFIPWCVLREAVASVFSSSCHAPSHLRGKLAVCVGSDRMTALQGWTVKQCGQLAWLAN